MNVFAKFDEIPSMILEVIKETKRYEHTDGRSDNVKTVYPPTNTVCGGLNDNFQLTNLDIFLFSLIKAVLTSANNLCFRAKIRN